MFIPRYFAESTSSSVWLWMTWLFDEFPFVADMDDLALLLKDGMTSANHSPIAEGCLSLAVVNWHLHLS